MPNRLASAIIVSLLVLLGTGCLKNPSAVSGGSSTGMSCQSASPTAPGSPALPYDAATLRETLGAICPAFGGLYFDASTLVVTSRPDGIEDVAAAVERYNATRSNVPPMRFTSVANSFERLAFVNAEVERSMDALRRQDVFVVSYGVDDRSNAVRVGLLDDSTSHRERFSQVVRAAEGEVVFVKEDVATPMGGL